MLTWIFASFGIGHRAGVAELLLQRRSDLVVYWSLILRHRLPLLSPGSRRPSAEIDLLAGAAADRGSARRRRRSARRRAPACRRATSITFETWIAASRSAMPPWICLAGFGRTCFLASMTCSTRTRPFLRSTCSTRPCLPRSRPAITSHDVVLANLGSRHRFSLSVACFRRPRRLLRALPAPARRSS